MKIRLAIAVSMLLGVIVFASASTAFGDETRQSSAGQDDWLAWVNHHRGLANLPPVVEDAALSDGAMKHAIYMRETKTVEHSEDPSSPWYTPEGDAAAAASDLSQSYAGAPARDPIDRWMDDVGHAWPIIRPDLQRVGWGRADGATASYFALDVIRGIVYDSYRGSYPVIWPGDGKSIWLLTNNDPIPATSPCAGHRGLPLLVYYGRNAPIAIDSHSMTSNGAAVVHCAEVEKSTTGLVVVRSKEALVVGRSYTVTVTNNGVPVTWTFNVVAPSAVPTPAPNTIAPSSPSASPSHSATPPKTTASPSGSAAVSTGPSESPSPLPGTPSEGATSTVGTTAVTLEVTSGETEFGRTIVLYGTASATGDCNDELLVYIDRRVHGTQDVETYSIPVTVEDDGSWSLETPAVHSTSYTATVPPFDGCAGSSSTPVDVLVRVKISARAPSRCTARPVVRGAVLPAHPQTRVLLEKRRGRAWRTVDKATLDAASKFRLFPGSCAGTYRVRWPQQSEANLSARRVL